jgi:hypothetical protein
VALHEERGHRHLESCEAQEVGLLLFDADQNSTYHPDAVTEPDPRLNKIPLFRIRIRHLLRTIWQFWWTICMIKCKLDPHSEYCSMQCWGSACFLASCIRIHYAEEWIRTRFRMRIRSRLLVLWIRGELKIGPNFFL